MSEFPYEPNPAMLDRINNDFVYHKPLNESQTERYGEIRESGRVMALGLLRRCPQSRELSLALTKIDEAVMHANAAIARNET